jgi:hypothetical protein
VEYHLIGELVKLTTEDIMEIVFAVHAKTIGALATDLLFRSVRSIYPA